MLTKFLTIGCLDRLFGVQLPPHVGYVFGSLGYIWQPAWGHAYHGFFLALHRFQSVFCCADYDVFLFLGVALVFKSVTYEIGIIHVCSK